MAEIPAEFVLANPTLCGEAIVEAWKAEEAVEELAAIIFKAREPEAAPFSVYRESGRALGTRQRFMDMAKAVLDAGYRKPEPDPDAELRQALESAKPDHSADAGKMADANDARCECGRESRLSRYATNWYCACGASNVADEARRRYSAAHSSAGPPAGPMVDARCSCGHEFSWSKRPEYLDGSNRCPKCHMSIKEANAREMYAAAHPPAEPAKPAETPAEVEGLARELFGIVFGKWDSCISKDLWLDVARHVLRLVRAARIEEARRAMCELSLLPHQKDWQSARISELKGGE